MVNGPALTRAERLSLAVTRFVNERPAAKRAQHLFLSRFNQAWVRHAIGRRIYTDNIDWLLEQPGDRGVLLCMNHRSYFDAYITMFSLYERGATWCDKIYFPVRSNFFYEHPEGTRGKGPDPYQLLPAQPGVGQVVLQGKPMVVPAFVNGLSNSYAQDIADNYRKRIRRERPVIIAFGDPIDYSDLAQQRPRAALYKRTADRIRDAIIALGAREREIRAACLNGEIADDAPGWVMR
jgi:1-acyl-sn-glycerol-3-phosphate acyltransferase